MRYPNCVVHWTNIWRHFDQNKYECNQPEWVNIELEADLATIYQVQMVHILAIKLAYYNNNGDDAFE